MTDANPNVNDDVFALAQAFARDELDHDGQQRLYELLRSPGDEGRAHARVAWQALAMDTDLRAHLGHAALTDALRLRLDDGGGFLRSVMQRLGWSRPQLQPVGLPSGPTRHRSWTWILVLLALLVLAIVWWLAASRPLVQVVANSGNSRFNAAALPVGASLQEWIGDGVLVVSDGVRLGLRFAAAAEITIDGPAQSSLVGKRLAMSQGLLYLESNAAGLEIGLPDGSLWVAANSRLALRVDAGQSAIGVTRGEARLTADGGARISILAGRAYHQGKTFAWRGEASKIAVEDTWSSGEASSAIQWRMLLRWQPTAVTDNLRVVDSSGTAVTLVIATDHLRLGERRWDLSGPPLGERRLRIERWNGRSLLYIHGLSVPVPLDVTSIPELHGAGLLIDLWHSGPSLPIADD